jgi:signal transduction histidine kinase
MALSIVGPAGAISARKVSFSIQVFDINRHLIEEFGPIGHRQLSSGFVRVDGPNQSSLDDVNLRSFFTEIQDGTKLSGYLQVQVSARQRDDALKQIVLTMVSLSPFLALAVAVCGSWFAGNAAIEETMELLRQFVADAAHEINTPISVIEASVQTLEATFEDSQLGSNVLAIINRASGRMKSLGQSLVVLSRMESPDYPPPIDHIRLDSIASPVLAECEQLARARRIKLCCDPLPEVTLLGNSESLERLLLNLVANAIRYTDEEVSNRRIAKNIGVNGIGVESMPHIFQRFYRVDKSRSRDIGGFGLGLAIVKAIIDRHKGEIQVESEVGKGSRFTVSLKRLP